MGGGGNTRTFKVDDGGLDQQLVDSRLNTGTGPQVVLGPVAVSSRFSQRLDATRGDAGAALSDRSVASVDVRRVDEGSTGAIVADGDAIAATASADTALEALTHALDDANAQRLTRVEGDTLQASSFQRDGTRSVFRDGTSIRLDTASDNVFHSVKVIFVEQKADGKWEVGIEAVPGRIDTAALDAGAIAAPKARGGAPVLVIVGDPM